MLELLQSCAQPSTCTILCLEELQNDVMLRRLFRSRTPHPCGLLVLEREILNIWLYNARGVGVQLPIYGIV